MSEKEPLHVIVDRCEYQKMWTRLVSGLLLMWLLTYAVLLMHWSTVKTTYAWPVKIVKIETTVRGSWTFVANSRGYNVVVNRDTPKLDGTAFYEVQDDIQPAIREVSSELFLTGFGAFIACVPLLIGHMFAMRRIEKRQTKVALESELWPGD